MADAKVWNQRDETSNEVAESEGYRRRVGLAPVRLRFLVVEGYQKLAQAVRIVVKGSADLSDGIVRDSVFSEGISNNGIGFDRVIQNRFDFTFSGLIRLTRDNSDSVSKAISSQDSLGVQGTNDSLFAPTYPPRPIEMAPAVNSASPPRTTTLVSPSADRPALRAKGTVKPSDSPRMASDMIRGFIFERGPFELGVSSRSDPNVWYDGEICASRSLLLSTVPSRPVSSSRRTSANKGRPARSVLLVDLVEFLPGIERQESILTLIWRR